MRILSSLLKQIRLIRTLKFKPYLSYKFGSNKTLKLKVSGKNIWLRKKSPDLEVALSCFNGEFDLIKYIFPKDYSGVIVDAGGYIGTAAIAFSEMYPKACVITVEPSTDNFQILKKNIANYKNITAINGALLDSDDKKVMLRNRNTGEWGFTVIQAPKDNPDANEMDEVPGFRLSTLGVKLEDIGILKIDIEGGEHAIMSKDAEDLDKIPVIMMELHDRIIEGCSDLFFAFSKDRIVIKDEGEKFLSIKKLSQ